MISQLVSRIAMIRRQDVPAIVADFGLHTGFEICGGYRRGKPMSKDIDIVVHYGAEIDELCVARFGRTKMGRPARQGWYPWHGTDVKIELTIAGEWNWGAALMHCTGDGLFNMKIRSLAKSMGITLSQNSEFETEEAVFRFLGLAYVAPEDRNGQSYVIRNAH